MDIVIGKSAGFCYGVKRAIESSEEQIKNNANKVIYCLGELVHNKQVIEKLKEDGIKFIDSIDDVKEKESQLIIRAHGIPKKIYEDAKKRKIHIKDFTCPNVLKIHQIVRRYRKEDFFIFLTGCQNHPEVQGIISYCDNEYAILEDEEDIEKVIKKYMNSGKKKVLLVSQTTYSLKKFKTIQEKLLEKIDYLLTENTICLATEVRQKETDELSKKVNKMIIIGGKNSSNTKKLYEIACKNCKNTICIETASELINYNIDNTDTIGIMAGASTPNDSINDVVAFIRK